MKLKSLLIGLMLCVGLSAQAQNSVVTNDNGTVTTTTTTTNGSIIGTTITTVPNGYVAPSPLAQAWTDIKDLLPTNGIPTNYAGAIYGTYAPKAPTKIGGGILVLYNLNNYVAAGIGGDWLGSFNLVSGNIQLRLPTHPLSFMGGNWATLEATPFVLGGIGSPFGGAGSANGGISTIEDAGFNVGIGHFVGGVFDVGAAYGKWQGAGAYDVARYHLYFGWSKGF